MDIRIICSLFINVIHIHYGKNILGQRAFDTIMSKVMCVHILELDKFKSNFPFSFTQIQ